MIKKRVSGNYSFHRFVVAINLLQETRMNKNENKQQLRQVELMKKRFNVDEEKKLVDLTLNYETASEVLITNLDTKVPTFDRDKFGRIKEIISEFPNDYKVNLDITIQDYEGYKPEEMLEGFNDAVELTIYSGNKDNRIKWLKTIFLMIAGILVLFFIANGIIQSWAGISPTAAEVLREVLDISAWVFVWQAVSLAFLTPSEDRIISTTLKYRLNNVILRDKNSKITAKERYSDSYDATAREDRLHLFGRYSLLVSGAAFFALGSVNFLVFLTDIYNAIKTTYEQTGNAAAAIIVNVILASITLTVVAFEILGGLAAVSIYTGRTPKLQKLALPFGITTFALQTMLLIVSIIFSHVTVSGVVGVIVSAMYLFGVIVFSIRRKAKAK